MNYTKGIWKSEKWPYSQFRWDIVSDGARVATALTSADAALIAAAPDLLTACKDALIIIQGLEVGTITEIDRSKMIRALIGVINKAEDQ